MITVVLFNRKKDPVEAKRKIVLTKEIIDSVITYAKSWHPNEGILSCKEKKKKM